MRSDNLKTHMKVHEKKSNKEKNQESTIMEETETAHEEGSFNVSVNKNLNNTMKKAELRKILEKFSKEYDEKINLGETIYELLGENVIKQESIPSLYKSIKSICETKPIHTSRQCNINTVAKRINK